MRGDQRQIESFFSEATVPYKKDVFAHIICSHLCSSFKKTVTATSCTQPLSYTVAGYNAVQT